MSDQLSAPGSGPDDTAPPTDIDTLRSQAAARPADPVAAVRLALALRGTKEVAAAHAVAVGLIERSLRLSALEQAADAARMLFMGTRQLDDGVLHAEMMIHQGDLDGGRRVLETLLAQYPREAAPRVRLMALALADDNPTEAIRLVEPVATRDRDTRAGYLQCLIAGARLEEAIDFGRGAVEAFPNAPELYQCLGIAHLARDEVAAAIEAFGESLRLDPRQPGAHYNLAVGLSRGGSVAAALGVVDAGLELTPSHGALLALKRDLQHRMSAK